MKVVIAIDSLKGSLTSLEAGAAIAEGIDAFFPILREIVTLDQAMEPDTARRNLAVTTEQIFRLIKR